MAVAMVIRMDAPADAVRAAFGMTPGEAHLIRNAGGVRGFAFDVPSGLVGEVFTH